MKEAIWHALKRRKIWEYGILIFLVMKFLFDSLEPDWDPKGGLIAIGIYLLIYGCALFYDIIAEMDHVDVAYSHADIEVSKYGKVQKRISYNDVGAIVLAVRYQPNAYAGSRVSLDLNHVRLGAAIAVCMKKSKILSRMTPREYINTNRRADSDVFDAFEFSQHLLMKLMKNTVCGLYITDQVFEWYEDDLADVIKQFPSRILICCYDEDGKTIFYTYHDYKLIVNNASLQ